jgi:hypothetical protein
LIAEIPSGALADKFGRNRIAKTGILLAVIGFGFQIIGGFSWILLGESIIMIGFALISGADEALFFEKLKFPKKSFHWRRLIMRASQMDYLAGIVAVPIGGFLYGINPRLPFIMVAVTLLVTAALIWRVRDAQPPQQKQKMTTELRDYLFNIKAGFKTFVGKSLRLYIPIILTLQGLLYIFDWGLLKNVLLDRFHFSEEFGGVVIGMSCIVVILALHLMHRFAEKISEKLMLTMLSFLVTGALILSIFDIRFVGILVIFVLRAGNGVMYPFISEIINRHAPPDQRATAISVASFLKTLPYVALAPLIGLMNMQGHLGAFLGIWAVLIILAWLIYFVQKRRDTIIKTW